MAAEDTLRASSGGAEGLAVQGLAGRGSTSYTTSCWNSTYKKKHLILDIFVVVALLIIFAALEKATPRSVFIVYDTLYTKSYPYRANSVPSWSVPFYSILAPLAAFILWKLFERRRTCTWFDCYRVFMASLFASFLTGAITNALKTAIGRPRPNFYYQCWPSGNAVWENNNTFGGFAVCEDPDYAEEFRKSFPSGHSSWSAAGLGFLGYFILGQTRAFVGRARTWAFMLGLVPVLAAVVVGVTRITDYWHNVSDVCFGLALGYFIAFVTYLSIFPFWTNELCHVPRYVILKQARSLRLDKDKDSGDHAGLPV